MPKKMPAFLYSKSKEKGSKKKRSRKDQLAALGKGKD